MRINSIIFSLGAALCIHAVLAAPAEASASVTEVVTGAGFTRPGGGQLDPLDLKDRPVLINFWATWCPPCRQELPLLAEAHGKYGARVAFVGLAVEDNSALVGDFVRAYALPYPVAAGRDAAIALMQELGNGKAVMPFTVIFDAEGRMIFARAGVVSEQELTRALAPYLAAR